MEEGEQLWQEEPEGGCQLHTLGQWPQFQSSSLPFCRYMQPLRSGVDHYRWCWNQHNKHAQDGEPLGIKEAGQFVQLLCASFPHPWNGERTMPSLWASDDHCSDPVMQLTLKTLHKAKVYHFWGVSFKFQSWFLSRYVLAWQPQQEPQQKRKTPQLWCQTISLKCGSLLLSY